MTEEKPIRADRTESTPNGAAVLAQTLLNSGVDVVFANPGTSEMHFVAALEAAPQLRYVPCMFEGVASAAADGYARMTGRPAATLLHLAPGLANSLANLHNAAKAHSPIINIVGEHATFHREAESPLAANLPAVAHTYSDWVQCASPDGDVGSLCAEAVEASRRDGGRIATLMLPADAAWSEGGAPGTARAPALPAAPSSSSVDRAAEMLNSGKRTLLFLGGRALSVEGVTLASDIAQRTNSRISAELLNSRIDRRPGGVSIDRLPFNVDLTLSELADIEQVISVDSSPPAAFFAYPGRPSLLAPTNAVHHTLSGRGENPLVALRQLTDKLVPSGFKGLPAPKRPSLPEGLVKDVAEIVAECLPENAVIVDEAISLGEYFYQATAGARAHTWLQITGGSIGIGLPLSVGAAVACPERKIITLQADGSALYTTQALWTQARENLNITTVILSNRSYAILVAELLKMGIDPSARAYEMLGLTKPDIDWVALAGGYGVQATRASNSAEFKKAFVECVAASGPRLIELVL